MSVHVWRGMHLYYIYYNIAINSVYMQRDLSLKNFMFSPLEFVWTSICKIAGSPKSDLESVQ